MAGCNMLLLAEERLLCLSPSTPPLLLFMLIHPPAQFLTGEAALTEVGQGILYVLICVSYELDLWMHSGKHDNNPCWFLMS